MTCFLQCGHVSDVGGDNFDFDCSLALPGFAWVIGDAIQGVYLACRQGFVIIFFSSSTGWRAILQQQCSQARCKLKMDYSEKILSKPWKQAG